ncbi:hypothetical protein OUY22_33320, partial [Nonomuraea sp. MCN248]
LGGAAAHVSWVSGDQLNVQFPAAPDQRVRVLVEDPGAGRNAVTEVRAGTPEDPHVMRLWSRIHPDVVSSVLVHELSHVAQTVTATAGGAPQGVIRPSLTGRPVEGDDLCVVPRLDEHAHLSRKWHAATDAAERARLADAIDAIAADLDRRGQTPPPPPWGTGERDAAPEPRSRIDRLLNGGMELRDTLSGRRPTLPESAASAAIERATAAMGGRTRVSSTGVIDVLLPGRPPIRIEVRPPQPAAPNRDPELSRIPEQGGLVFQVDGRLTIGATERAAAAMTARAIALAQGLASADQATLAELSELSEAVRQVRTATVAQRPGRLGVLFDLVSTADRETLGLLPEPVAAELATLAANERPRDWAAILHRLRTLANTTGWDPPECLCPEDGPCTCGGRQRPAGDPADALPA